MSRTDFEAAYIERYGHRPRGWNDDFQVYQDAHANGAWFGWQAGAAGIEAKAAPVGEPIRFWFIGDAGQQKGSTYCKKSSRDGSLAFFECEEDANRAALRHAGTEVYSVEYYRKPQAGAARQRQSGVVMPDVSAMAKVLSDRAADACNIDRTDNWAMYGQEYIDDVQAMLEVAHLNGGSHE